MADERNSRAIEQSSSQAVKQSSNPAPAVDHAAIAAAAQSDRPVKPSVKTKSDPAFATYMHQAGIWLKTYEAEVLACYRACGIDKTCQYWNISRSTMTSWLQRRKVLPTRYKGGYGRPPPAPASTPAAIKSGPRQHAPADPGPPSPLDGWTFFDCTGEDLGIIIDSTKKNIYVTEKKEKIVV